MAVVRVTALTGLLLLATAARHAPPPPVELPAPAAAPTIKTGVEKWRAGDYAVAVAIWTPFATAGDADALFNLGQAYKLGRGVPVDAAQARDYYRRAATKGHLPAQANLGIALFQAGEKPEAIKWLKLAADRGEARAQYVLGIAAFNGDGIGRSGSLGYAYLLRAQASGLPQATTALSTIAPGLSPVDRSTGETIAASLAAGGGVPPGLALATASRLLPVTPPARTALPVVTPPVPPATRPALAASLPTPAATPSASTAPPTRTAAGPASSGAHPASAATASLDKPVLLPVPKPSPAVPLHEPSPAQADLAAQDAVRDAADRRVPTVRPDPTPATSIATVAVPASRPVAVASAAPIPRPAAAAVADPLAPRPRIAATDAPRETTKSAAPLKPFETAVDLAPKKLDGWRVQLGAFSSRKLADAAWADVKTTAAPAKPVFATDGAVTKLQMGPFASRDAAKAACTKLTAAGRACFVTQG